MKRQNRKKIILRTAVCYFILLAVLTFASDWILKKALPTVEVQLAAGGYINNTYYNIVLDREAVQYDENGELYVLIVESRDSPLGTRYIVRRIPVTMPDWEAEVNMAAVEGAIEWDEMVVRRTGSVLESGDQVRIRKGY